MAHLRAQIRNEVRTRIQAALSFGLLDPTPVYDKDVLPSAAVTTPSEDVQADRIGGRRQRELTVIIEVYTNNIDDLPGELDGYAELIERALDTDTTLGGIARSIDLDTTEHELSDGAEQPRGILRMTYLATYSAALGAPDVVE